MSNCGCFNAGKKSAVDFNFPDALVSVGSCGEWTAEYCFRNLDTMANLDENGAQEDGGQEEEEKGSNAKRARRSSRTKAR